MADRNLFRKERLAARSRLDTVQRELKSGLITGQLAELPAVTGADHLFIYINFSSEVVTIDLVQQLIAAGKTVSVPVTLLDESRLLAVQLTDPSSQLAPGCYGIPEPTREQVAQATVDPASIDTVLVPGSVFDRAGGRLGYGGGFYDRFLVESAPRATRVALAFAEQLVDRVPMQPHDQYMDLLVTDKQVYDCRRLRHAQDSGIQG